MTRPRLAVTGRNGQVVRALLELGAASEFEILPLGRPQLDLSAPENAIVDALVAAAPDAIVSAAAYTLVDQAEAEPELAFAVNERGAAAVARAAAILRVPIVHLSTDYVFDGSKSAPYSESDPVSPRSTYGASKLAGERAVLAEDSDTAVLRTAWVYSPFGSNFVRTMLRLAADREEVGVVADQLGNPTSALDIADAVIQIARNLMGGNASEARGIFHMTAAGEASWADFAEEIFRQSRELGGPSAAVKRITTADFPTRAERPANSRLICEKLAEVHGLQLPGWRSSLQTVVRRLIVAEGREGDRP